MPPSLTDPQYLQALLEKHDIHPQRSAGQNFLVCEEPVEAIITALDQNTRQITELGAGLGSLTAAVLAHGYTVRAIERDQQLGRILQRVIPNKQRGQLDMRSGDLREVAWEWDKPWQLVGNIPYNLSGYIVRRLTQLPAPPTQAIFMVQREVGLRLAALASQMSLLGLTAQMWGAVHPLLNVPRSCFWPAPQVDSMVVLLVPHTKSIPLAEREAILTVARVFFQQKRKQIGGVMKRNFGWPADRIAATLAVMEIAATARPQELSMEQWQILNKKIVEMTKHE